jgi:hypothetical protein
MTCRTLNKKNMLKNLLYAMFLLSLCVSCSTGDDDDVFATEDMIDWYVVQDKPGKVNRLLYDIYKNEGMTIFINDTLYREEAEDQFGNPIVNLELFDVGYYVFSTDSKVSVRMAADSVAMIKALNTIREKVLPYLPKSGAYRPRSILLVDSVLKVFEPSRGKFEWSEVSIYQGSLKGVAIGQVGSVLEMDDLALSMWAGRILGAKSVDWIQENCDEYVDFENKTNEGRTSGSNYGIYINFTSTSVPPIYGFFNWYCRLDVAKKYRTPALEDDLIDYIAAVYAYRGKEGVFKEKYKDYYKMLDKFELAKKMVEKFEITQGIR